jgi:hypothetical protein
MPVFNGNTSTNATSTAYENPFKLKYFNITNKSGGVVTVNVGILYGSTFVITPYNLVLSAGDMLVSDDEILVAIGHQIYLTTTGSVDYYFALE